MKTFFLCMIPLLALAFAGLYGLPMLRSSGWRETRSSKLPSESHVVQPGSEEEIAQEMAVDPSEYDSQMDIRKIRVVPATPVALEAAFRMRKNDLCEPLPKGEPIELSQYTLGLTPRDSYRSRDEVQPSTRREVLTIGLTMLNSDQRNLPTLSRSIILDFLKSHYLSLQARVQKDPVTSKLRLHYRPIAAVARYSGLPLSQDWNEAVASTVEDICGLGMFESTIQRETQTAVILFRSHWLDEQGEGTSVRHELAFLHAVPSKSSQSASESFEIHLFTTSQQRTRWHYFPPNHRNRPRNEKTCGLVGTVRFDSFSNMGLQPKSAVTRKIATNASAQFELADIESFLVSQRLQGGWSKNLDHAIEGILEQQIPSH